MQIATSIQVILKPENPLQNNIPQNQECTNKSLGQCSGKVQQYSTKYTINKEGNNAITFLTLTSLSANSLYDYHKKVQDKILQQQKDDILDEFILNKNTGDIVKLSKRLFG